MESFRTADGRTLSYRRDGPGPLLLCHPGGPGFSSRYFGDLAGLGESFTLILLNPRGSEGSDRPTDPRAYETADYVSDLDELRAHLALERMPLLGHSHGGVVAAAYAAAYPDRVERLVLASTLARFADQQHAAMEAGVKGQGRRTVVRGRARRAGGRAGGPLRERRGAGRARVREFPFYFRSYDSAAEAYLDTLRGEAPVADALLLFNNEIFTTFDLRPDLSKITAPTLVITGKDDFITGPACAADFASIPHATTVVLPDGGHFIFVEARDRFREETISFLD
jgi:pimeloyl-ACP methyl ester carboxylesterase